MFSWREIENAGLRLRQWAWHTFSRPSRCGWPRSWVEARLEQTSGGVAQSGIRLLLERPWAGRRRGGRRADDVGGGPGHPRLFISAGLQKVNASDRIYRHTSPRAVYI